MKKELPSFSQDADYLSAIASGRLEDALLAQRLSDEQGNTPAYSRRKPFDRPAGPPPAEDESTFDEAAFLEKNASLGPKEFCLKLIKEWSGLARKK